MKIIMVIFSLVACLSVSLVSAEVRLPAVAGTFYPDDSSTLNNMVARHLAAVGDLPAINGRLIALIVPHAGLVYSGEIAAHSYSLLRGTDFDRVILCGPSHRYSFKGVSVYGPGIEWRTPLGDVTCDDDYCQRLLATPGVSVIPEAHKDEHSLEVQLPYLQTVLPEFRLVPMVMGQQGRRGVAQLAEALTKLPDDGRTILIAATDWQHYQSAAEGWPKDSLGIACLEQLDPERLQAALETGQVEACGGGPMVAVLRAAVARGANRVKLLRYGDSGDISGDKSAVVGYVAAVVYRDTTGDGSASSKAEEFLSASDKELLLRIARTSIASHLNGTPPLEYDVPDNLRQPGAAFVTLEKAGRLRGCIGYTVAVEPLWRTVASCAVSAAVNDRRFSPVTAGELSSLHLEISVLTPLEPISSLDDIEVGRDGLMIVMNQRRGLLLPQVATDYGWSRRKFLEQTCQKAGLPAQAYIEDDVEIFRFQALVFSE